MPLTWSAVIATYLREHILPKALQCAAQSSRPPSQIIVVDGSPNWRRTRERVMREIAVNFQGIEWIYEKAKVISSAHQRNQGVEHARSDLIFFLDDDSLMYPDCAHEIVNVFEKDAHQHVVGIGAALATQPPDVGLLGPETDSPPQGNVPTQSKVKMLVRGLVEGDSAWLLPYDGSWPAHVIPKELLGNPIVPAKTLVGCGMCVRRSIAIRERFETILLRYAYLEDSDMSYRASRHGLLLYCLSAKICHLAISSGRLPAYVVAFLGALNPAVLHRIYSNDKVRSESNLRKQMLRRMIFLALKDLEARQLTLPSARGVCRAIGLLSTVMRKSESELREWYPQLQKEIIESNS